MAEQDLVRRKTGEQGGSAAVSSRWTQWAGNAWRIAALPLILLIIIPVIALFTRITIADLLASLQQEAVRQAIGISMKTTVASLAVILCFGTPLAYLMGRHEFRYKKALDTLIDLPTVLPPSVAGLALLMTFGRRGLIGGWLSSQGIEIAFTATAVVLAQIFIAAPFYVRAATIGFTAVDDEIEQAAQLDGASRGQIFRYVILPLSRASMLSGATMSWARALGEFGATILFAGNFPGRTQTMPTAIYLGFERDLNSALSISALLIVISFASLLFVKILIPHGGD